MTGRTTNPIALFCSALLLASWLAGCAHRAPTATESTAAAVSPREAAQPTWWYLRFRLANPHGAAVASHLDGLIADQVLAAQIERHRSGLVLWRFHRRWPEDAVGHQFSFIFFAPRPLAEALRRSMTGNTVLAALQHDGWLRGWSLQAATPARAADRAGTSDPTWPTALQREWPAFIMGASRMWLGLVSGEAARHQGLELHARYRAAETHVDELWFAQGNHALLHHLSALFGYRPVRVIRRDIMTF